MTITATRSISFDAAHRLVNHESKCRYVHGHRYTLDVTFSADALDEVGRVVDFGVIKELLGGWIDRYWDHNIILFEEDKALGQHIDRATGQQSFYLPYNPTAENMARYIFEQVIPELFAEFPMRCTSVLLHETPNCSAGVTDA